MDIVRFSSARAFRERAEPWLLRAEAEHNLLLGLARRLEESTAGFQPPIYLATVEDDHGVAGCAFRTPPFPLGLTRMPPEALPPLVEDVAQVYAAIPGVLGPGVEARAFAALWSAERSVVAREEMRERIYQLEAVVAPAWLPGGRLRSARPEDVPLLEAWGAAFVAEAGIHPADPGAWARDGVARGTIVVWEDGEPRAMAAEEGRSPHGARIGLDLEPAFVRIAQRKTPGGDFFRADMMGFDLGRTYDVVLCLFGSIGYVRTLENLRRALECFRKHLAPGGVVVVEPWFEPAAWQPGRVMLVTAEGEGISVCRMSRSAVRDGLSVIEFEYLIGRAAGIEHRREVHELGLFTAAELAQCFAAAGLDVVEHDREGLTGRGLFVARAGA